MYDNTDLGVDLIRAERERQIIGEGYTPDHDLNHDVEDLIFAGVAYLLGDSIHWPWSPETFKSGSTRDELDIRDLVKAGALIAAAIDRAIAQQEV